MSLPQILADAEALAADPAFPATEAGIKVLASHPSLAAAVDLAAKIEADAALVKLLTDLTPGRAQLLSRFTAFVGFFKSMGPH